MPGVPESFRVRFNGGPENVVTVSTNNYRDAAAAAMAILGIETSFPMRVEIKLSLLKGEDPARYFLIEEDRAGRLIVGPTSR